MVDIIKTWETVYFQAQNGVDVEVIELSYNHKSKSIDVTTANEEAVSFKGDSISQVTLKIEALNKMLEYLKQIEKTPNAAFSKFA